MHGPSVRGGHRGIFVFSPWSRLLHASLRCTWFDANRSKSTEKDKEGAFCIQFLGRNSATEKRLTTSYKFTTKFCPLLLLCPSLFSLFGDLLHFVNRYIFDSFSSLVGTIFEPNVKFGCQATEKDKEATTQQRKQRQLRRRKQPLKNNGMFRQTVCHLELRKVT